MIIMEYLAQVPTAFPGGGELRGIGPLGLANKPPGSADVIFAQVISNIIGFLTIVAGLWFLFNVIIAGFGWLSAGGDKQKLADAQGKLTSSVIGLTVVVIGIFIVRLVTNLLGIQLVLDPVGAILNLRP